MSTKAGGGIGSLNLLGEKERRRLLEEWNGREVEYPREGTVAGLFEEQARRRPGAEALVCGEERLTYEELNRRGNRWGRWLRRQGAERERLVGICCVRSVDLVVGMMGGGGEGGGGGRGGWAGGRGGGGWRSWGGRRGWRWCWRRRVWRWRWRG